MKDFSQILTELTAELKARNDLNERLIGVLEKVVVADRWIRIVALVTGLIIIDTVLGVVQLLRR